MELAAEAAARAARGQADFLCLPEAADFGWLHQHARRDALPIPGAFTDFLASLAAEHTMWVSAGCLENAKAGGKTYNSAVIIDRTGRIVLRHRKILTLPEITSHLYDAGDADGILTADTEFGCIGLTICADNFDVEIPRRAARMGAWLLIAPHGFAAPEDAMEKNAADFQEHIGRVAAATGMWVAAANVVLGTVQGGAWKGRMHCGCSTVADPCGTRVAVGHFKRPDLVFHDIPAEPCARPAPGAILHL
jgi:predicted amidohydrolase